MDIESRIVQMIAPSLGGMGYGVVQVRLIDGKGRRLQVMAERLDGKAMTVEDCADISYQVSALLDVEDPIKGAYHLEISSPGIDRPLIKPEDFIRHVGLEIKLETRLPVNGRKRYKGMLTACNGKQVTLQVDASEVTLPLDAVQSAKLVLNDALIDWHRAQELPTN